MKEMMGNQLEHLPWRTRKSRPRRIENLSSEENLRTERQHGQHIWTDTLKDSSENRLGPLYMSALLKYPSRPCRRGRPCNTRLSVRTLSPILIRVLLFRGDLIPPYDRFIHDIATRRAGDDTRATAQTTLSRAGGVHHGYCDVTFSVAHRTWDLASSVTLFTIRVTGASKKLL